MPQLIPQGQFYLDFNRSVRENIRDIVFEGTPTETPMFDDLEKVPTKSILHGWLDENLTAYEDSATEEGAAFNFDESKLLQTRRFNWTQIFVRQIRISRSNQRTAHYGMQDLVMYELKKKARLQKTSFERAVIRNSQMASGPSGATRRMLGIIAAGSQGSNFSIASNLTLTDVRLNDFFQRQWRQYSGEYDLYVNADAKRRISGFTANQGNVSGGAALQGGVQLFRDQNDMTIVNTVSHYLSDFGPTKMILDRMVPFGGDDGLNAAFLGDIILVDTTNMKTAWVDEPFVERTAKVADSFDAVIISEFTLEYGNPTSIGILRNVT